MNCNIFCLRTFFVLLIRAGLIVLCAVYLSIAAARGQDSQLTPLPTPTATPSPNPTATPSPFPSVTPLPTPTPPVEDKQQTQPENLSGVPVIAPQFRFEDRSLPELGRVGVDMMQQKPLSLREALELALLNNKDIEVSRQNTRIAEFDVTAAGGVFQPRSVIQTFYERSTTPSASAIIAPDGKLTSSNFASNAQLNILEPKFGGQFQAQFSNSRLTNTSIVNTLNPQFSTNLNFQYTQPLLRGRRIDQNRRQIEISRRNLSLSDAQFRQRTIDVITNVQRAYWDLTFALKNLQVQRDSVRDAKDQLASNQRRVTEGLLAPIDVVAVETQVANFEQLVYDALNQVTISENNLKNLIAASRADEIWAVSIVPTDQVEIDPPTVNLTDAVADAVANRPELEQNQVSRDINQIDQRFARDQTKPQIDLIANYNLAGLAGTELLGGNSFFGNNGLTTDRLNQVIGQVNTLNNAQGLPDIPALPPTVIQGAPDNLTGGFFNSLTNLFAFRYPTLRLGVSFGLPFRSRTAEAQLGRSLVEGERLTTQRQQLEQNIQVEVRNALQFVRTAQARLRAAAIARTNGEAQYASEQRKFDEGQSTVFLVLERQTQLATARGNELRAQTELNKAIADLQRATGNSLRANNIVARIR